MQVVAVGSRTFIAGFQLAGILGIKATSPSNALEEINRLIQNKDIGLILISDDIAKSIRDRLTEFRRKRPIPLIYEIPAPGSKKEKVEYRDLLKQILGV